MFLTLTPSLWFAPRAASSRRLVDAELPVASRSKHFRNKMEDTDEKVWCDTNASVLCVPNRWISPLSLFSSSIFYLCKNVNTVNNPLVTGVPMYLRYGMCCNLWPLTFFLTYSYHLSLSLHESVVFNYQLPIIYNKIHDFFCFCLCFWHVDVCFLSADRFSLFHWR
mgnify:FL=1